MSLTAVLRDARPSCARSTERHHARAHPQDLSAVLRVPQGPRRPVRRARAARQVVRRLARGQPPANDLTARSAIMFLRQLAEQGGFWRSDDNAWSQPSASSSSACNPPMTRPRAALAPLPAPHAPPPRRLPGLALPARSTAPRRAPQAPAAAARQPRAAHERDGRLLPRQQARFNTDMQPHYIYRRAS